MSSPYSGRPIKLYVGRGEKFYVPEKIACQITSLAEHRDESDYQVARFPEIDDFVAHTLVHYLYTGGYQALAQTSRCDEEKLKYKISLLAYHAGLQCGLEGLAEQAKERMRTLDVNIPILDIISLARKHFPQITEDEWLSEYLTAKISQSFEAEEDFFLQDGFFSDFGEAPEFDKFLGKVV